MPKTTRKSSKNEQIIDKSTKNLAISYGISEKTVFRKKKQLGVKKITPKLLDELEKVSKSKKNTKKIVSDSKNIKKTKKVNPKTELQLKARLEKAKTRYQELYGYYNQLNELQNGKPLFTSTSNGTTQSPILDKIVKYATLLNQTDDTITKLEERLGIATEEEADDPTKAPERFLSVS